MNKYRIRDLREDNDLTQKQCAKIAFISKNSYIRYENEEREPPLDVIINLARYYKVSIDYIAGITKNKGGIGCDNNYKIKQKHSGSGDNVVNINGEK